MDAVQASTAAMAVGNGPEAAAEGDVTAQQVEVVKTPIERFNEVVEKNPLDFNSWVQLLALVESEVSGRIAIQLLSKKRTACVYNDWDMWLVY